MQQVKVLLFGTLTVMVNGVNISHFPTDKVRALLIYLALESDRPHRREYLAGQFWPEVPQVVALKNLRQTLYRLRQTLDHAEAGLTNHLMILDQHTVQINSMHLIVDAVQFQVALVESERHAHNELAACAECLARLRQAVGLYRGELLAGFGLADAPHFEEWLTLRREMLNQRMMLTLNHLSLALEANGAYEEAHRYAAHQLTLDPYREETHRQLMRLLAMRGLVHQALAQYETCHRVLREELGVEVEAETAALAEQIYSGKFPVQKIGRGAQERPAPKDFTQQPRLHVSEIGANALGENGTDAREKGGTSLSPLPNILPKTLPGLSGIATPLVGRQREQAAISQRLTSAPCRLLTLIGAGGVGKTTLAIQVASDLQEHFTDGVYFVDMTAIRDPDLVPLRIAEALGLHESGSALLYEHLKQRLFGRYILLVLDNFEQIITAAPQLVELLAACPRLKMLVTSRRVLHLRAEEIFAVEPLALPPLLPLPNLEKLADYPAVGFFLQRAQAALPNFQLTSANARAVAELCVYVDGLPLAIELVAARLRLLTPQAILTRLTSMMGARLALLTSGALDRPEHQQTLQRTIDWSYHLLEPHLQTFFMRLAVFVGGCTVEAAEAICGDGSLPLSADPSQVDRVLATSSKSLDALVSLLDQSLLHQQIGADGESRLMMLETIREYALERLLASDEYEVVQDRHVAYYLQLAEATGLLDDRTNMTLRLKRLDAEHGNLRAALTWSLEAMRNAEMVLRMVRILANYWYYRGYWHEGRQWLERALALTSAADGTSLRAQVGLHLAEVAFGQGDFTVARTWLEQSLLQFRQNNDPIGIASTLSVLGLVVREQGEAALARELTEESLARFREQNAEVSVPWTLCTLGELMVMQGDPVHARSVLEEALALFRKHGEQSGIGWVYNHLGHVAQLEGDYSQALAWHEASLPQFQDRDRNGMAWAFCGLGQIAYAQADLPLATSHYKASLALFRELGSKQGIAWSLAGMAGVADKLGQPEQAARFLGTVERLRSIDRGRPAPGSPGYEEQVFASVRSQLDEAVFGKAWAEGEAASLEQALAYVLDDL